MNKRQTRRMQSIRNKLMAAICMLLVSSIMMVSTTYAWFTLSTAPEVSGITTAVGANGNLEMALLPENGDVTAITSESGDGALPTLISKNVTWGNLVDLSDEAYGLDQITLYPAELNAPGNQMAASMLKTPTYGPDGRVSGLVENTVTSTYSVSDGGFPQNGYYGVRAVGNASGMTDRQLAYRNSRSAGAANAALAKNMATQSLNSRGSSLADIAIKHGTSSDGKETYTQADLTSLKGMITDLISPNGILDTLDKAYIQYIIGIAASKNSGLDDTQFNAFKNMAESYTEASELLAAINTNYSIDLSGISAPIAKLAATRASVEAAQTTANGLTGDAITWDEISPIVNKLADAGAMNLNGFKVSEVTAHINEIVNSVMDKGLVLTVASGGGVFADIADHCGDYSASIKIKEISHSGVTLTNQTARMETATTVKPDVYLDAVGKTLGENLAPEGGSGSQPITDMFGYVIDLAFRTNAAESKLLLQTEAVDRIYGEEGIDTTMGHGSTMTFKATTTDFSNDQVKALMKAVKIVFFNPDSTTILAKGSLAADAATLGSDGLTAKIQLSKVVTTYVEDTNGAYKLQDGNYVLAEEGFTGTRFKQVNTDTLIDVPADAIITPLTQNTAAKVSVLVYLDGNQVANKDVATAATSVTGKMNLQFASSATLVPMEYTPLKNQAPATNLNTVTADNGVTASGSFRDKSVTVNLTAPEGKVITGVSKVTVGDKDLAAGTYSYADGVLKFAYEGIKAETTVAITVTVEDAPTPPASNEPGTPESGESTDTQG